MVANQEVVICRITAQIIISIASWSWTLESGKITSSGEIIASIKARLISSNVEFPCLRKEFDCGRDVSTALSAPDMFTLAPD
jgi:hypothetical protein